MLKTDNLECLRIFCLVAQYASVKKASQMLAMEPSNIFRLMRQLDADAGCALFEEGIRPLTLTKRGLIFYERTKKLLSEHAQTLDLLKEDPESEEGLIRIASSAGSRRFVITPALVEYQNMRPGISVELHDLAAGSTDFFSLEQGTVNDIVISFDTHSVPAGVIREVLADIPFVACASRSYLALNGEPESPAQCARHKGLLLRIPGRTSVTFLSNGSSYEQLKWKSTTSYNSQLDAQEAAILGGGICPDMDLPYFASYYQQGLLVPVMRGWKCPTKPMCLFMTQYSAKKRRVRLFAEWFAARYRNYLRESLAVCRDVLAK